MSVAEITGASVCGGTVSYQLTENKKQNFGQSGVKIWNLCSLLALCGDVTRCLSGVFGFPSSMMLTGPLFPT